MDEVAAQSIVIHITAWLPAEFCTIKKVSRLYSNIRWAWDCITYSNTESPSAEVKSASTLARSDTVACKAMGKCLEKVPQSDSRRNCMVQNLALESM